MQALLKHTAMAAVYGLSRHQLLMTIDQKKHQLLMTKKDQMVMLRQVTELSNEGKRPCWHMC